MPADVTAIIPTYNRADATCRAIESILSQSLPVSEIIVVDDASTDNTAKDIHNAFGDRVRIITHNQNSGASAARNTGFMAAQSTYVAFLDSDDIWMPQKIELQTEFTKENDLDASCTNVEITYGDAAQSKPVEREYPKILGMNEIAYGCYTSPGSTLMIKKDALQRIGGYDTAYRRYEDWDLLLKLVSGQYRLGYLQADLALIFADHSFSYTGAISSLKQIETAYKTPISGMNSAIKNSFYSGVYFNMGATYMHAKNYGRGLYFLARSLMAKPFNNWLWKTIFFPAILIRIGTLKNRLK